MLAKHLTVEHQMQWVKKEDQTWKSFYNLLENLSKLARKLQGMDDTLKAIGMSGHQTDSKPERKKCATCGKAHGGVCYKSKVVATASQQASTTGSSQNNSGGSGATTRGSGQGSGASSKQANNKNCEVCGGPSHMWRSADGKVRSSKRITSCGMWLKSSKQEQQQIIRDLEATCGLCKIC